ncbi:MAG: hypothetical protein WA175_09330 [Candidatus Acidiferrales bacterium]
MADTKVTRLADTDPEHALEQATDKVLAVIESHMSNFSAVEQQEKWDALERYVSDLPASQSASRAKR